MQYSFFPVLKLNLFSTVDLCKLKQAHFAHLLGFSTMILCSLAFISFPSKAVSWPCFYLQIQGWARPLQACPGMWFLFQTGKKNCTWARSMKSHLSLVPKVHSDLLYHVLHSQLAKISSVLSSPSFHPPCASREDGRADSLSWTAWITVLKCNLMFLSLSLFASASSHGAGFCCATQAEKCPQLSSFTKLLKGEISPFLPEKNSWFFFPFFLSSPPLH